MGEEVISVKNLVKRYKELTALNGFSLSVGQGEIFGLLGPNGSGKSTTMNCILSLLRYDEGEIRVFGEKMTPESYEIKKRIGVVPQDIAVFDELTVQENIDYFCGLYVKDAETKRQYVDEAIDFVGLDAFRKFKPGKLSGGLKRRLNIACGIVHKPELIFFDEPTVAVDPQSRNKILENIVDLNKRGATIVYTTHYMEEVEQICTRIMIMDKGKSLADGTAEELKSRIKNTENVIVDIRKLPAEEVDKILKLPRVYEVEYRADRLTIRCAGGKQNIVSILDYLEVNNLKYQRIYSELPTLNDVFLEITGKELRDTEEIPEEKTDKKKTGKKRGKGDA